MSKRVSDEDKQRAQGLFAIGKSYRDIASDLEGRVSAAWLSKTARAEGWLRGVLPDSLITPDTPQIFESAAATPDERNTNTDYMSAAMKRKFSERKAEIADQLADGVVRLYGQMFSPHVLKEAKLRNVGDGVQKLEIVEIPMSEPSPADKKHLATALAILVDKASLLVGDATSRVETASLNPAQLQERLGNVADELAARRAAAEAETAKQVAAGATG